MGGTFVDRVQTLRDNVGAGKLTGSVEVNQRYAADQHWHDEYHHPDGGKAFYLRDPIYAGASEWLKSFADRLLSDEGKGGLDAMKDAMEKLSVKVYDEAPWEFGDLRGSGHPMVKRNDDVLYDRPPNIGRVSDDGLREKARLRELFDPGRYTRTLG